MLPMITARRRAASPSCAGAGEVAEEAAGERVAGPGGVEHHLERQGGRGEAARVVEHEDAVLALLHDQGARPQGADRGRGLHEVPLPAELARLLVVDEEDLHLLESLPQLVGLAVDPEVHGVAGHDAGPLDLLQHLALEDGVDVAEEDDLGAPVADGDLRLEELEDVEVGADRVAGVEVERVPAVPVEGLALRPLQPLEVDGPSVERGELPLPEVVADDPDEVDRGEEGGGHREEGGAAPEHALGAAEGRLDRVVGDAPDDEDGHALPRYFTYRPTIGSSSRLTASGTSSGGVTSA